MSTALEARARAVLAEEDAARLRQTMQQLQVADEQAQARQTLQDRLDALQDRLRAFDAAPLAQLRQRAADALTAYADALAAWNADVEEVRAEVHALGSSLPPTVDTGSYDVGRGIRIGDVVVRRQRPHTEVATLAKDALLPHMSRGVFSLDNPQD